MEDTFGIVAYACNPDTWEMKAAGPGNRGHPESHPEGLPNKQ